MTNYRLPDALVTNRSGMGLAVSVLCASFCSLGAIRACALKEEASRRGEPMVVTLSNGPRPPVAMPDAATGVVDH